MEVTCWGEPTEGVSLDVALCLGPRPSSCSASKRRKRKKKKRPECRWPQKFWQWQRFCPWMCVWATVMPSLGTGSLALTFERQMKVDVPKNPRDQELYGNPFPLGASKWLLEKLKTARIMEWRKKSQGTMICDNFCDFSLMTSTILWRKIWSLYSQVIDEKTKTQAWPPCW